MTQERWQALTHWPLIGAALAFLVAYSWEVIADLSGSARVVSGIIIFATWATFAIDYGVRLRLASDRGAWFRHHIFDLLVVVLPALRPVRLLKVLTLVNALQRTAGTQLRSRIIIYGLGSAVLLIWVGALTVFEAERGAPGANILSFGNALWWAFVTITTVGYGDFVPVTIAGRLVAVGLMVCGVAVLGITTATLASWVLERASAGRDDDEPATRNQVRQLAQQINALASVQGVQSAPPPPTDATPDNGSGLGADRV